VIGEARCEPVSPATRHKTKKGTNDTVCSSGLLMRLLGALCVIIMAMANPTELPTAMITAATTTFAPIAVPQLLVISRSAAATDDLATSTSAADANATIMTEQTDEHTDEQTDEHTDGTTEDAQQGPVLGPKGRLSSSGVCA
jgi:hypothetical protein